MTSSKPVTPIRRSNSRPGSGSSEFPLTSSLEVLAPGGVQHAAGDLRASKNSIPLSRASSSHEEGSARRSTKLKTLSASRPSEHQSLLPLIPNKPYNTSSSRPSSSSTSSFLPSVGGPPPGPPLYDTPTPPSFPTRAPSPQSSSPAPHASSSPALVPPTLPPLIIDNDLPPASANSRPSSFQTQAQAQHQHQHQTQPQPLIDVGASSSSAFSALLNYGGSVDLQSARASSVDYGGSVDLQSARASGVDPIYQQSLHRHGPLSHLSSSQVGGHGRGYVEMQDVRASHDSVVSGRSEAGGTFFTGLRKEFEDEGGGLSVRSSMMDNPMQSPSASVGDEEEVEKEEEEVIDAEEAEYMTTYDAAVDGLAEFSNPIMTPRETDSGKEDVSRTSLLSMIHDLYSAPEPERPPSSPPAAVEEETEPAKQEEPEPQAQADPDQPPVEAEAEAGGESEPQGAFLTEVKESMLRMETTLLAQEQRRNELGAYIERLQTQVGEDGTNLVEMPKNYLAMVEGLIRKQRGEYSALQGWLGPRRFEDLPINNLPEFDEDPQVTEGLSKIKELDGKLNDRTVEAMIVNRETFPERFAEDEAKRMLRHQKHVEATLKKQRMLHMRAAKLNRVVTSTDGSIRDSMAGSMAGSEMGDMVGSKFSRFFQLRPEEEELVEAVLNRSEDAEEEAVNPFDISLSISSALMNATSAFAGGAAAGGAAAADAALAAAKHSATDSATELAAMSVPSTPGGDQTPGGWVPTTPTPGGGAGGGLGLEPLRLSVNQSIASFSGVMEVARQAKAAVLGLPLSVINARLDEYMSDHVWDQDGVLADFAHIGKRGGKEEEGELASEASRRGGAAPSVAGSVAPYKPEGGARSEARSVGTSSMTANGKRDYLREEREAKALAQKENDIDARLRAFKTGEYPARLDANTLASLIAEARKMEESREHRISLSQPSTPGAATPAGPSGRGESAGPLKPGMVRSRPPTLSAGFGAGGMGSGSPSPAAGGGRGTPSSMSSAPGAELFISRKGGSSSAAGSPGPRQQSKGKPNSRPPGLKTQLSHGAGISNNSPMPVSTASTPEGGPPSRPPSSIKHPSPGRGPQEGVGGSRPGSGVKQASPSRGATPTHGIVASRPNSTRGGGKDGQSGT